MIYPLNHLHRQVAAHSHYHTAPIEQYTPWGRHRVEILILISKSCLACIMFHTFVSFCSIESINCLLRMWGVLFRFIYCQIDLVYFELVSYYEVTTNQTELINLFLDFFFFLRFHFLNVTLSYSSGKYFCYFLEIIFDKWANLSTNKIRVFQAWY